MKGAFADADTAEEEDGTQAEANFFKAFMGRRVEVEAIFAGLPDASRMFSLISGCEEGGSASLPRGPLDYQTPEIMLTRSG